MEFDLSAASVARTKLAGRRVVASVSGGKDSAAMSLYLTELGIEHDRMFLDTGWEHALTTELKVFPAQRWLAARADELGVELVNAVGIRRAESKARSAMSEWEWSDGFDLETWRPLVAWSVDDVRAIHARHGLAMNPLYELGATRVGCWPCIHARKSEIALVAEIDPDRIDLIGRLTDDLNSRGAERDQAMGRTFMPRSMYGYHGGDNKHISLTIAETVEWARSKRGEFQPPAAGDGCMRWGVCDIAPDEGA